MKNVYRIFLSIGLLGSLLLASCQKQDNETYYSALVTVKPNADNTEVYFQLDDNTQLFPVNITASPYGKEEMRAFTTYRMAKDNEKKSSVTCQQIYVNVLNSILTKDTAENLGEAANIKAYGNDAVEIVNDWVTIAEDGYLNLRFRTYWGGVSAHTVNLVYDGDDENPYHVSFYHDANGDLAGRLADGLVAFRLTELPDTHGETVDLTMEWNSFSGYKKAVFKYCTRKSTNAQAPIANGNFESGLAE